MSTNHCIHTHLSAFPYYALLYAQAGEYLSCQPINNIQKVNQTHRCQQKPHKSLWTVLVFKSTSGRAKTRGQRV